MDKCSFLAISEVFLILIFINVEKCGFLGFSVLLLIPKRQKRQVGNVDNVRNTQNSRGVGGCSGIRITAFELLLLIFPLTKSAKLSILNIALQAFSLRPFVDLSLRVFRSSVLKSISGHPVIMKLPAGANLLFAGLQCGEPLSPHQQTTSLIISSTIKQKSEHNTTMSLVAFCTRLRHGISILICKLECFMN